MDERRHVPRLLLSLACYVISAGITFAQTVTLDETRREFHLSVGEVSAVLAGLTLLRPVGLIVASVVIDLIGPTKCVSAALFVAAVLCFAMSKVETVSTFYLLRSMQIFVTAFDEQPAHICLVSTYFREWQPLAVSVINSGYSLAGATFPVALAPIAESLGWRAAWMCVGVASVVLCVLAVLLLKPGPLPIGSRPGVAATNEGGNDAAGAHAKLVKATGTPLHVAFRTAKFWALVLASFCVLFWEGTITTHLILMLTLDAGLPLTKASALYSSQYVAAIVGKVSVGVLVRMAPRKVLFVLPPLVFCASHFLLLELPPRDEWSELWALAMRSLTSQAHAGADVVGQAVAAGHTIGYSEDVMWLRKLARAFVVTKSTPRLVAFAGVYGLSFGMTHSLVTVQPTYLFGRRYLPYFQTMLMIMYTLGMSAGQVSTGWAYDAGGELYGAALLQTFAVSAVNVVFFLILGRAKGWEEEEEESSQQTAPQKLQSPPAGLSLL